MNILVLLNVRNLRSHPKQLKYAGGESTSVPSGMAIIDLLDAGDLPEERVGLVDSLDEVQVVEHSVRVDTVFEDDDVRVVDGAIRVITRNEGRETQRGSGTWGSEDGGDAEDSCQDPFNEWRHSGLWIGREMVAAWITLAG